MYIMKIIIGTIR